MASALAAAAAAGQEAMAAERAKDDRSEKVLQGAGPHNMDYAPIR